MMKQTTCYSCDKPIEPEWLPEGEFIVCDECSSDTDKLLVEKLQEQLNTAKKALECIINSNDTAFGFVNSNLRRYVEDALAAIGGYDEL